MKLYLDEVLAVLLTDDKDAELNRLMTTLDKLESVIKALRDSGMALADARTLFDGVIERFPLSRSWLLLRSSLVGNSHFEVAIINIQRGYERIFSVS